MGFAVLATMARGTMRMFGGHMMIIPGVVVIAGEILLFMFIPWWLRIAIAVITTLSVVAWPWVMHHK